MNSRPSSSSFAATSNKHRLATAARLGGALGLMAMLACAEGGGCDSDYDYPRSEPAAAPTQKAIRGRMTQSLLDELARGLPDLVVTSCMAADESCALDNPYAPSELRFYIGAPGAPIAFEASGVSGSFRSGGLYPYDAQLDDTAFFEDEPIEDRLYCDDTGGSACFELLYRGTGTADSGICRPPSDASCTDPATDYCCGGAAKTFCDGHLDPIESCYAPRSYVGLDLASLRGNVHFRLVPEAEGGGIQLTLGCNDDDVDNCIRSEEWVRGSMDMVMYTAAGGDYVDIGDAACYVRDDPELGRALDIHSLRFTVRPHIELGVDSKPYLVIDDDEVMVDRFELDLSVDTGPALDDPACYDDGYTYLGGWISSPDDPLKDCTAAITTCGTAGLVENIISFLLEQGVVGRIVSTTIARSALRSLATSPLEAAGELDLGAFMPLGGQGSPIGYLIAANTDSPTVTGAANELGLNIDLNTGFITEHSSCVPEVTPPSFSLPAPPDPGTTVMAADPLSGTLRPEAFDVALLVGDAVPERALFNMFDGGDFCFYLAPEEVYEMSGGVIMPDAATIGSIVASDLLNLVPPEAPVGIGLVPHAPLDVAFGTGEWIQEGEEEVRDSHLKLFWSGLEIELYPLFDDTYARVAALAFDVQIGISLEATAAGDLQIFVDRVKIESAVETYNEMLRPVNAQAFEDLAATLLELMINGEPIDIPLTAATMGMPFIPHLRAVSTFTEEKYLGLFLRLCTLAESVDPMNLICNPPAPWPVPPSPLPGRSGSSLSVSVVEKPAGAQPPRVAVRVASDLGTASALEVAYRVDGRGPYFGYRRPQADGQFNLDHPMLALPGTHSVEVFVRPQNQPLRQSEPAYLTVEGGARSFDVAAIAPPAADAAIAEDPSSEQEPNGCAAIGGSGWILAALLLLRRRR